MKYIEVIDVFRTICHKINERGTFYHGRVSDANLALEKEPFPQIHTYPFRTQSFQNSAVEIVPNIQISFLYQDSPHSSKDDRDELISKADDLQIAFRKELDLLDISYTGYETTPFFKEFNGVASGMYVRFSLTKKAEYCV